MLLLAGGGTAVGMADGAVALLSLLGLAIGVAVAGRWSRRLSHDAVAPIEGPRRG